MAYWISARIVRRDRDLIDAARVAIETDTSIPLEDGRPSSALRHQVRQALASAKYYPTEPWMRTLADQITVKVEPPNRVILVPNVSTSSPSLVSKLPTLFDAISQLMIAEDMVVPSVSFWVPADGDSDSQAEMFQDGVDERWNVTRLEDKDRSGGTLVSFSAIRRTHPRGDAPSAFDLLD